MPDNSMRYRELKNTTRGNVKNTYRVTDGDKIVRVDRNENHYLSRRTYISQKNKNVNNINSLHELTKNWVFSNTKKRKISFSELEIDNFNMSHFLRFVKMIKSRKPIYEKIKQVMNVGYLDWYAKSKKIELLVQNDKFLRNEYNKMKSMYLKGDGSCNENTKYCSIITSIISLI